MHNKMAFYKCAKEAFYKCGPRKFKIEKRNNPFQLRLGRRDVAIMICKNAPTCKAQLSCTDITSAQNEIGIAA